MAHSHLSTDPWSVRWGRQVMWNSMVVSSPAAGAGLGGEIGQAGFPWEY
jgi:hypothetical protein